MHDQQVLQFYLDFIVIKLSRSENGKLVGIRFMVTEAFTYLLKLLFSLINYCINLFL
jgi:hypothetical protein